MQGRRLGCTPARGTNHVRAGRAALGTPDASPTPPTGSGAVESRGRDHVDVLAIQGARRTALRDRLRAEATARVRRQSAVAGTTTVRAEAPSPVPRSQK